MFFVFNNTPDQTNSSYYLETSTFDPSCSILPALLIGFIKHYLCSTLVFQLVDLMSFSSYDITNHILYHHQIHPDTFVVRILYFVNNELYQLYLSFDNLFIHFLFTIINLSLFIDFMLVNVFYLI